MSDLEQSRRTLVAVHAHPDDECLTTGGTLARYSAEGVRTVVVTCTLGDAGGVSDAALAGTSALGDVRAQELAEALRILGVSRSVLLGYRDSGMAGTPENDHPEAFHQVPLADATRRLVAVLRAERPQVLVSYDERGGYGHPDHLKAHQVAVAAFRAAGNPALFAEAGPPWQVARLCYVVFPRSWVDASLAALRAAGIAAPASALVGVDEGAEEVDISTPDAQVSVCMDVARYVDIKHAALAAHRSQMGPGNTLMRTPLRVLREIWRTEFFRDAVAAGPGPRAALGADLFGGLSE